MMHDIITSVLGTGHPNFKEDQIQPGDYFLKRKLGFYSDILILKFTQESSKLLWFSWKVLQVTMMRILI